MERNMVQQYPLPLNGGFSIAQDKNRHGAHMIYPNGTFSAHSSPQPAVHPSPRPTPPLFYSWSNLGTNQGPCPSKVPRAAVGPFHTRRHHSRINGRALRENARDLYSRPNSMNGQNHTPIANRANGLMDYVQIPKISLGASAADTTFPEHCTDHSLDTWNQKAFNDVEFAALDQNLPELAPSAMANDDDDAIVDLRRYPNIENEYAHADLYSGDVSRRVSDSSFSLSSAGPIPEVSSHEDFPTSEAPSYVSDRDGWSNLEQAQHLLSPMPSPRHSFPGPIRDSSRSWASPTSHSSIRTSPYNMDSGRNKRWSTGMYPSTPSPVTQGNNFNNRLSFYGGSPHYPRHSATSFLTPVNTTSAPMLPSWSKNMLSPQPNSIPAAQHTLFSSPDTAFPPNPSRQYLPSQGFFRSLQSNGDHSTPGFESSHFAAPSDPPDLYSSLNDPPSDPPESDMKSSDPDLVPHEQDLRFSGDLYTPRWVRGHGNKREGWCGLCKPGRWLVLKNSAFWYDKSFTHGVSAATGAAFRGPGETRRTEPNMDTWEGLCSSCGDWVNLVSNKKKGTTWFRHAYKCHPHPKVKDGPKRRRESANHTQPSQAHPKLRLHTFSNASNATPSSTPTSSSTNTVIFGSPSTSRNPQDDLPFASARTDDPGDESGGALLSAPSGTRGTNVVAGVKREREVTPQFRTETETRASASDRAYARSYAVDLPDQKTATALGSFVGIL